MTEQFKNKIKDSILNTLWFTDDEILFADSKDNIQRSLHTLYVTASK
jgi:hypothetical protein